MREKSGKALIYNGFKDNERNEREKRNVTFALHLLYVWARFERCLKGIALHRGGECYVFGCPDGCVGVFRWLLGVYGCSCGCFIVWTWKRALVGLKTACLGGD